MVRLQNSDFVSRSVAELFRRTRFVTASNLPLLIAPYDDGDPYVYSPQAWGFGIGAAGQFAHWAPVLADDLRTSLLFANTDMPKRGVLVNAVADLIHQVYSRVPPECVAVRWCGPVGGSFASMAQIAGQSVRARKPVLVEGIAHSARVQLPFAHDLSDLLIAIRSGDFPWAYRRGPRISEKLAVCEREFSLSDFTSMRQREIFVATPAREDRVAIFGLGTTPSHVEYATLDSSLGVHEAHMPYGGFGLITPHTCNGRIEGGTFHDITFVFQPETARVIEVVIRSRHFGSWLEQRPAFAKLIEEGCCSCQRRWWR